MTDWQMETSRKLSADNGIINVFYFLCLSVSICQCLSVCVYLSVYLPSIHPSIIQEALSNREGMRASL